MIRLDNVSFIWRSGGSSHVIGPLSFSIRDGGLLGCFGRSGTGKTTLLRIISGELVPRTGEISRAVSTDDIIYHDQHPKLIPWMSAKHNIEKMAISETTLHNRVFDAFGLTEFAEKLPCELSGGQRARVALARTVLAGGKVKLFDEPFSGIDIFRTEIIVDLMSPPPNWEAGMMTAHDPALLIQLCDEVLCLKDSGDCISGEMFYVDKRLLSISGAKRRFHEVFIKEVMRLQEVLHA